MKCKYCFCSVGRHATWCPGYEHFTKEETELLNKVQDELILKRKEMVDEISKDDHKV